VAYRDKLKASLMAQLQEEREGRARAEARMDSAQREARDERGKRLASEEELRRSIVENDALRQRVQELHEARDGAGTVPTHTGARCRCLESEIHVPVSLGKTQAVVAAGRWGRRCRGGWLSRRGGR
jgi:hypothetical protein